MQGFFFPEKHLWLLVNQKDNFVIPIGVSKLQVESSSYSKGCSLFSL